MKTPFQPSTILSQMVRRFHFIQSEAFKDYASKFKIEHRGNLLSLFLTWAESKDFSDEDRQNIFAKFLSHFAKKFLDKNYGY